MNIGGLATLATLMVKIKADPKEMDQGLEQTREKLNKFSNAALGIGTAITGAFVGIVMETAKVGDEFDKMSRRTGVAVDDLSALSHVAELSGTNLDSLERGVRNLQVKMHEANEGSESAVALFESMGIAIHDAEGNLRSTTEVFGEVAGVMEGFTSEAERTGTAAELFGRRAGPDLIPMLSQGQHAIEEQTERARELGIVISEDQAKAAAEFTDAWTEIQAQLSSFMRDIGHTVMPILSELMEAFGGILQNIRDWIDRNPELFETLIKLVAAGGPILLMAGAVGKILAVVTPLLPLLGTLSATTLPAVGAAIVPLLPTILPIAGVVLAVYLAWKYWPEIVEFLKMVWENIKEFAGWLWDTLTGLASDIANWVVETWNNFAEGISSRVTQAWESVKGWASDTWEAVSGVGSNIAESARTAWTNYRETTEKMQERIGETFTEWGQRVGNFFSSLGEFAYEWGEKIFSFLWEGMQAVWETITGWLDSVWESFTGFFKGLWESASDWFRRLVGLGDDAESISEGVAETGGGGAFQFGGRVSTTGMALVHAGEVVLPPHLAEQGMALLEGKGHQVNISFGNIVIHGEAQPGEVRATARQLTDTMLSELRRRGVRLGED